MNEDNNQEYGAVVTVEQLLERLDGRGLIIEDEKLILAALGYFEMTFETNLAYQHDNY